MLQEQGFMNHIHIHDAGLDMFPDDALKHIINIQVKISTFICQETSAIVRHCSL